LIVANELRECYIGPIAFRRCGRMGLYPLDARVEGSSTCRSRNAAGPAISRSAAFVDVDELGGAQLPHVSTVVARDGPLRTPPGAIGSISLRVSRRRPTSGRCRGSLAEVGPAGQLVHHQQVGCARSVRP
jgi:hypothetical protein